MARDLAQRLLNAVLSLVGVAVLIFLITEILPGDPARVAAGPYATPDQIATIRQNYGLNASLLHQFGNYLTNLLQGDLGNSIQTGQPVRSELTSRLAATLELTLTALIIAVVVGVALGAVSAMYRYRLLDRVLHLIIAAVSATATFWIALLAIATLVNRMHVFDSPVGRLPAGFPAPGHRTGFFVIDALTEGNFVVASQALKTLIFPAALLGLTASPSIAKVVRSAMIQAFSSDYVRTSRSFGYSTTSIVLRDALRNSLLPVLTTVGLVAGFLIGGDVIIEQIFSWPGIGQYAYNALQQNDLFALRGFVILVGLAYVLVNTGLEVGYRWIDPRVSSHDAA